MWLLSSVEAIRSPQDRTPALKPGDCRGRGLSPQIRPALRPFVTAKVTRRLAVGHNHIPPEGGARSFRALPCTGALSYTSPWHEQIAPPGYDEQHLNGADRPTSPPRPSVSRLAAIIEHRASNVLTCRDVCSITVRSTSVANDFVATESEQGSVFVWAYVSY